MKSLLYSRKFWLSVLAVVTAIASHYLSIPEDIWQAIVAMLMVLIGTIAVEDVAKIRSGVHPSNPGWAGPRTTRNTDAG